MSQDAYIRLDAFGHRHYRHSEAPDALLFVDVEPDTDFKYLRTIAYRIFGNIEHVLVRLADSQRSDMDRVLNLLKKPFVNRGVLLQRAGEKPKIDGVPDAATAQDLLDRARAIEVGALLEWGRAVWKPQKYHYLLPNGMHSSCFVRAANAIRSPRDAHVLATWLLEHFSVDDVGLILDSGTLTSVAIALEAQLQQQLRRLGPTITLEHYPRTSIELQQAAYRAIRHSNRAVALVSVSSSGQLLDRLYDSLQRMKATWSIDILVDEQSSSPRPSVPAHQSISSWFPRAGDNTLGDVKRYDKDCRLCRDDQRARLVPIDPMTLTEDFVGYERRVTPNTSDPRDNSQFWTLCSESKALELSAPSDTYVKSRRPQAMAIRVNAKELLAAPRFASLVAEKIPTRLINWAPDLVLVPENDLLQPNYDAFWARVRDVIGGPERVVGMPSRSRSEDWAEDLVTAVTSKRRVLFLTLGAVTGATLQQGLVALQRHRTDIDYKVEALIVHARLETLREWETLDNSFSKRLLYIWQTFLPSVSPLDAELRALNTLDTGALSDAEHEFLERRRGLCNGALPDTRLFWGCRTSDRLSAHSIYGNRLDPTATFVAVGAAIERRRSEKCEPPERLVFDMRPIVRSYYDPLILASMLRWFRAAEIWWGSASNSAEQLVEELLCRADPEQHRILIPEIRLAAAQGKLSLAASELAANYAGRLLESEDSDVRVPAQLALKLTRLPA